MIDLLLVIIIKSQKVNSMIIVNLNGFSNNNLAFINTDTDHRLCRVTVTYFVGLMSSEFLNRFLEFLALLLVVKYANNENLSKKISANRMNRMAKG